MKDGTKANEITAGHDGDKPAAITNTGGDDKCTACLLRPCIVERHRMGLHGHATEAIIVDNASNLEIYERLCDVLFQHMQWHTRKELASERPSSLPICCKEGARDIVQQTIAENMDYSSDDTQWTREEDEGEGF
jgi:hypothetical protein